MEHFLLTYTYFAFLPLAILEGPIVTIVGAFFAGQGYMNIYIVYALAVAGDTLGDGLHYALGRYGGVRMVRRFGARFGVTVETLHEVRANYFGSRRSLWKIITAAKVTHAPCSSILVTCGLLKVNVIEFLVINFVNNIFKVLFFVLIGFYFGQYYKTIDGYIARSWMILIPVFILVVYFFYRKRAK
jgi:membrane protein DedA with SNARE-associated domain